jgi:hypothetical protein
MAVSKGNGGVVKAGGAVIAEVKDWSYDGSVGVVEKPAVMGETVAQYVSDGRKTGSGSINIVYDPADVPQGTLVEGATIALEVHETGTAVGTVKHTGTVVISSVGKSGGSSDFLQRSISFSGVLTQGTN